MSKEQREQHLQQAQLPVVIPTDHALAINVDLSLPWNKLRIIRRYQANTHVIISTSYIPCRWLKGLNVSMASEAKQRVMARDIVGDNLAAEKGSFTFSLGKGGDV